MATFFMFLSVFFCSHIVIWRCVPLIIQKGDRMKESEYQSKLKKRLQQEFPDAIIQKLDSGVKQGVPDLLILNGNKWAALEVKRTQKSTHRPNQDYYVKRMNEMSYASFVYPENEEEVVDELKKVFKKRKQK